MSELGTLVKISADALIGALIVVTASRLGGISRTAGNIEAKRLASVEVMNEYREWSRYDDQVMYSQDIVSTILQYRGEPEVWVNNSLVNTGYPIKYTLESDYSNSASITAKFPSTGATYKTSLYERTDENNITHRVLKFDRVS